MICITKDTLRKLNSAVGKLDTDTNRVFNGFVGRLEKIDMLYHGELQYVDVVDEPPKDTVSIKSILSPEKSKQKQPETPSSEKATKLPPSTKQPKRSEDNGDT